MSPDGLNVYVASYDSSSVAVFVRDFATGALTQLAGTAGCLAEWKLAIGNPAINPNTLLPSSTQTCIDGDPRCDADKTRDGVRWALAEPETAGADVTLFIQKAERFVPRMAAKWNGPAP